MDPNQKSLAEKIAERFAQLPKPVQDAIRSSDVQAHLRKLFDAHNLHLDQWQVFENEVFFALLGFQRVEDLEENIKAHIGLPADVARQLAIDVNAVVFEPIRGELERGLEHPAAKAETVDAVEAIGAQVIAAGTPATPAAPMPPAVQPATPPAPAPDVKVTRPSGESEYRPGQASHERKSVSDDPYRESIL